MIGITINGPLEGPHMRSITLHGKHGNGRYTLVSDEDYHELNNYRWTLDTHGYIIRSAHKDIGRGKTVSMHRHIMKPTGELRVDHIDGNPLNNQRDNLSLAEHHENLWNRGKQINNKSNYKGVCKINSHQRKKVWIAQISIRGKHMRLGYFKTKEEAVIVYNQAALKHHGEFARLNSI